MSAASQSLTVRVPLAIRQRGGRKVILTPPGTEPYSVPAKTHADPTLIKALARAFRWKRLLENGTYSSISEMAAAEKIDRGYLGRILLLTLLAPDIVEAILDGRMPELSLARLMQPFPLVWSEQRLALTPGRCTLGSDCVIRPLLNGICGGQLRSPDCGSPQAAWRSAGFTRSTSRCKSRGERWS